MHKFRTILSVVATAAMVLGTMGVASAASANETRADFIVQLDQSLGIQPVTPSAPDFTDVPSTNADYGYIEAAYQKGFISGIAKGLFGPTLPITRAEAAKILVEAYEGGNYTPTQTSTTFTDNSSIPTALVGYVAEAASLKLMLGFTSGGFGPEAYLTTAQETHLVAQLKAVQAAAAFKVSASATDVAVGQIVTLSSTGAGTTTYAATGANASSALISGSSFVASAAGNYVVTGTNSGLTGSVTIGVYGTATGLKISAPTSVVANGASQTNVTVSVVDANGNVVANNTDNVSIGSTNTSAGGVSVSDSAPASAGLVTVPAVNGVATFVLTSGTVPGATTTLYAEDTDTSSIVNGGSSSQYTAKVTASTQTATSLAVTPASTYVSVNSGNNPVTFDVQVLDQSGQPMLYGTYPFSVSISGPAQFQDGTTTAHSFAYTNTGSYGSSAPSTSVTVNGLQGQTGAITATVSGTNLKSATGTVTAVISGAASALQLVAPSSTSASQDDISTANGALGYAVQVVDSHGYPVADSGVGLTVTVKNSSGSSVTGFTAATGTTGSDGSYALNIEDGTNGADAGTYTVQVAATNGSLTSTSADSFTITAGAPKGLALSGANYISAANPTDTITAQVVDKFGNSVAIAGIPVTFVKGTNNSNNANMNLSASTAYTNASGAASITATVPAYVFTGTSGTQYQVGAEAQYNYASPNLYVQYGSTYAYTYANSTNYNDGTNANTTFGFSVESSVATGVSLSVVNDGPSGSYIGSNGIATAGQEVTVSVYATDQYGNDITTPDQIHLAFGGTGAVYNALAATTSPGSLAAPSIAATNLAAGTSYSGSAWVNVPLTVGNGTELGSSVGYVTFYALGSGQVTITATDESAPGSVSSTASLSVQPGAIDNFALLDSSGNNASSGETVSANTPLALTLSGSDAYGNTSYQTGTSNVGGTVYTNDGYVAALSSTSPTGTFRATTSNATEQAVVMTAGSTSAPVYYVDTVSGQPSLSVPAFLGYVNGTYGANTVTFVAPVGTTLTIAPYNTPAVTANSGESAGNYTTFQWGSGASGTATFAWTVSGQTVYFQFNY